MMDRLFRLREHDTTVTTEVLAGITTFLTMSYILVVQPNVLSRDFAGQPTGLEAGAVLLATCLASAFACVTMGIYARLPVALAPGMGQNFFFVSVVSALSSQGLSTQPGHAALAIVLVAGVVFFVLTVVGLRAVILDVMSPSMRSAIAVGIGLFIAFIGLKNANLVVASPTLVTLNAAQLISVDGVVFWTGLLLTLALTMWQVPGSMLIGILIAATVAWSCGKVNIDAIVGAPELDQTGILQFDFGAVLTTTGVSFVAVFVFMDVFDTTGTLVAVTEQAGLSNDGNVPQMREAMLADSMGTVAGACFGTSTVTSYIESAAGVEQGGRTGLTAVTVGILFLLSIAFSPLIIGVGSYLPITAPALVVVGSMMFRSVKVIDWQDSTEAIPAFLVILGIPTFFSIADGIALGLVIWPILKLARGRQAEVPWPACILAALLVTYFMMIRVNI